MQVALISINYIFSFIKQLLFLLTTISTFLKSRISSLAFRTKYIICSNSHLISLSPTILTKRVSSINLVGKNLLLIIPLTFLTYVAQLDKLLSILISHTPLNSPLPCLLAFSTPYLPYSALGYSTSKPVHY